MNPTVRMGEFSRNPGDAFDPARRGRRIPECLQLASLDGLYQPAGRRAKPVGTNQTCARWLIHAARRLRFVPQNSPATPAIPTSISSAPPRTTMAQTHQPAARQLPVTRRARALRCVCAAQPRGGVCERRQGVCWNLDRPLLMDRAKIITASAVPHRGEAGGSIMRSPDTASPPASSTT